MQISDLELWDMQKCNVPLEDRHWTGRYVRFQADGCHLCRERQTSSAMWLSYQQATRSFGFCGIVKDIWKEVTLKQFLKVLVPRLMAMPAGEVREVFCGSYTTFAITSGFISFLL